MTRRQALIVLLAMIIGIPLAGCDNFYHLTIENHLDQPVVVVVPGHEFPMRPCSVRDLGAVSGPPFRGTVSVEARNAAGDIVYQEEIKPESGDLVGQLVEVRISGDEPGACPPPVTDTYLLTVRNQTDETMKVKIGETVWLVGPRSIEEFGPLPGDWREAWNIEVPGSQGTDLGKLDLSREIDFDLGTVPQVVLTIRPGWRK